MTAAEIVTEVKRAGGSIEAVGPDRIRVLAPSSVLSDELKAAVVEQKPALLVLLRATDVLESQRLLRKGEWPPTLPVCPFHIGKPGLTCKRCGASWLEHFLSRLNGTTNHDLTERNELTMTSDNSQGFAGAEPISDLSQRCKCVDDDGHRCKRAAVSDATKRNVEQRYVGALLSHCAPCFYGICQVDGAYSHASPARMRASNNGGNIRNDIATHAKRCKLGFSFSNGALYADKDDNVANHLTFTIQEIMFEEKAGFESELIAGRLRCRRTMRPEKIITLQANEKRNALLRAAKDHIVAHGPIRDVRLIKSGKAYYFDNVPNTKVP